MVDDTILQCRATMLIRELIDERIGKLGGKNPSYSNYLLKLLYDDIELEPVKLSDLNLNALGNKVYKCLKCNSQNFMQHKGKQYLVCRKCHTSYAYEDGKLSGMNELKESGDKKC